MVSLRWNVTRRDPAYQSSRCADVQVCRRHGDRSDADPNRPVRAFPARTISATAAPSGGRPWVVLGPARGSSRRSGTSSTSAAGRAVSTVTGGPGASPATRSVVGNSSVSAIAACILGRPDRSSSRSALSSGTVASRFTSGTSGCLQRCIVLEGGRVPVFAVAARRCSLPSPWPESCGRRCIPSAFRTRQLPRRSAPIPDE